MRSLGDLTGKRFRLLTVVSFEKKDKGIKFWNVVCDCGNRLVVRQPNLINGNTNSCGCFQKKRASDKLLDLTGMKFGRLTVVSFIGRIRNHSKWNVLCDCGKTTIVDGHDLKTKKTVSCGCYNLELKTKHGYAKTHHEAPEYRYLPCT